MAETKKPHAITFEPAAAPLRIEFGGEVVAETDAALILREGALPPVAYIPNADVRWELMQETDHQSFCPYKGTARYWSVTAGGKTAENAVWAYPEPIAAVTEIQDRVAFYWNRMDAWHLGGEKMEKPNF